MSQAAEHMFDQHESDLLGNNIAIVLPEFGALLSSATQQYSSGFTHKQHEKFIGRHCDTRGQRRDGSMFEAELGVGTVRGIEPPRYVVFVRDISERKHREEALQLSESALRTAQSLATIGNYVIYFDGSAEDYASPQLLHMFDCHSVATLHGHATGLTTALLAVVHPSDRAHVMQAFVELDAVGQTIDIEYRTLTSQFGLRYMHHLAQVVRDINGRVVQHVGTVHDITERRLAGFEVQQMQNRITHSGRVSMLGEMATGIAHEVNQPLAAIATYANACLRLIGNNDCSQEELIHTLEQISQQALRAGEVIRSVRSFVKYHEAKLELTDSNRLLEELLQLAQTDAHYHNVQLLLEPAPHLPLVRADPIQIQQVLLNLVRNAIDAMHEVPEPHREIVLRTRLDEQDNVEFMVADRGPGVSKTISDELFNPFYTTKANGTGLGLSISMSIIRAHGGKLWHADDPGGGARFFFSLLKAI